jgi:predicted branched-subunit amino acid permease
MDGSPAVVSFDFRDGLTDVLPALPGIVLFGMVFGVAAIDAELTSL